MVDGNSYVDTSLLISLTSDSVMKHELINDYKSQSTVKFLSDFLHPAHSNKVKLVYDLKMHIREDEGKRTCFFGNSCPTHESVEEVHFLNSVAS